MASPQASPAYLAENRGGQAELGIYIVTALSTVVVLVRLYARGFLIREAGLDDYLIIGAQLLSWLDLALTIMVFRNGAGQHLLALVTEPAKMVRMYKWLVAAQLVYFLTLWVCRVSGLAFYARLNPLPRFRFYIHCSTAFVTAVWVAQTLVIGLQCIPLQALWDQTIQGKCLTTTTVFLSTSILTIICDSLMLLLPLSIVRKLQASITRKIALLVVFCFGIVAILTSILRMVAMVTAINNASDITWYFSVVMAWSTSEISAMIVALSLPALRGLFGFIQKQRSANKSYTHDTSSIGLTSVPRQQKGRIFEGSVSYPATIDIHTARSPSQEALWDANYLHGIQIKEEVHVNTDDVTSDHRN